MGAGARKLREQVEKLPLDKALKAAVLEGVERTDDSAADREAAALEALFSRLPEKLRRIRAAVARDEAAQRATVARRDSVGALVGGQKQHQREPAPERHLGRTYEVLFILSPTVTEQQAAELIESFKTIAEENGAVLKNEEAWGRRRLAYPIHKFNEGIYHLFVLESDRSLSELDRRMKNVDLVLRHVIVRTDLEQKRADKLAKRNPKKEERIRTASLSRQDVVKSDDTVAEPDTLHLPH